MRSTGGVVREKAVFCSFALSLPPSRQSRDTSRLPPRSALLLRRGVHRTPAPSSEGGLLGASWHASCTLTDPMQIPPLNTSLCTIFVHATCMFAPSFAWGELLGASWHASCTLTDPMQIPPLNTSLCTIFVHATCMFAPSFVRGELLGASIKIHRRQD